MLLFEETLRVGRPLGWAAIGLGLTEVVRYPQYRMGIFAACKGHPALRRALDLIVERVNEGIIQTWPEPARTLTLTGPGLFTDAVSEWVGSPGTAVVPRSVSLRHHYGHAGMGTWKHYSTMFRLAWAGMVVAAFLLVPAALGLARYRAKRHVGSSCCRPKCITGGIDWVRNDAFICIARS